MKRIGVVYDKGGASPTQLMQSSTEIADVIFICVESEHNMAARDLLEDLAPVVWLMGRNPSDWTEQVTKLNLTGITTFSETALELTADLSYALGLPFHRRESIEALTRKYVQRRLLNQAGFRTLGSALIWDLASAGQAAAVVGFPSVLKPNIGAGSRDTFSVANEEEFWKAVKDLCTDDGYSLKEAFVLEEFISGAPATYWGDYVSVESAVIEGNPHHLAVAGKTALLPPFRETGEFIPADLPSGVLQEVEHAASRALRSLGVWRGICHTEIKLTDSGPQIIEVNGRLGGYTNELLLRCAGVDLIQLAMRIAMSESVAIPDLRFSSIAFQYSPPARIMKRSRVASIDGIENARQIPEIQRLNIQAKPGRWLDPDMGAEGKLFVAWGECNSYERLQGVIRELDSCMTFSFADA